MTSLALPDVRLRESWAAAILEFGSDHIDGSGMWHLPEDHRGDLTYEGCRRLVAELARRADPTLEPEAGTVHSDYFWLTDGQDQVVGFLALRHRLNDYLLNEGGHIGYSVRASRRREGHAKRGLALALGRAAGLGIERALVTCDIDNEGSRRAIEANGGELEDVRHGKLRFWIGTQSGR